MLIIGDINLTLEFLRNLHNIWTQVLGHLTIHQQGQWCHQTLTAD